MYPESEEFGEGTSRREVPFVNIIYWSIVGLVATLLTMNAHGAVSRYLLDSNHAKLTIYLGSLMGLGYFLMRISYHVILFAQAARAASADLSF